MIGIDQLTATSTAEPRLPAPHPSDFGIVVLNMGLESRQVRRWQSSVFGERGYLVLSLVAKSVLAWQVSARTQAG